jgi:ribonuclease Z
MSHEFSITLLGTGCPVVSTERFGPASLVCAGRRQFLVDVGSGATQRLIAAGANSASVDALLITHIHSDHLVDLYQFVISSWHQSRDRPHRVYGPPGIAKFVDDCMEMWRAERELRIAFEQRSSVSAFEIEVIEIDGESPLIDEDGVKVTPVLVEHQPVEPAFGFVFEAADRKLVLSGDTRYCRNLIAAAKGADLLVHEVFVHRAGPVSGTRTRQGAEGVASYHTLSSEVGRVAAEASAGCLALSHIVPPDADRQRLIDDARSDYDGPIVVGEDLMRFDLVAGTVTRDGTTFTFA